ncbi:MSCRAMM family adhesin SdrC [Halosolutus halophilus]|uniref:MSCRAMM family adhesin SdrC n=1 Tax=Halosolutus halophilus TaxID=1552990 RepID=UPI0022351E7C|nr:MSCRAMM family adhesin SdrC [Halosolutus halophilus]
MTDSTADKNASDGSFEAGPSADELFGEIAESVEGGPTDRERGDASTGSETIEDRTAADVFDQLQSDVGDDTDGVLADESPEDIIASADEPDPDPADDDLLVDEDALEDLLLTGRTKEKEFLWVDSDDGAGDDTDGDGTGRSAEATDTPAGAADESPTPDAEGDDDDVGRSSQSGGSIMVSDEDDAGDTDSETGLDADADSEAPSDRESASESDDSAPIVQDEDRTLANPEDEQSSSGILGWLRSKIGGLF